MYTQQAVSKPNQASIAQLRDRLRKIEKQGHRDNRSISTGCPALDSLLPAGGFRPGTLVDWLAEAPGSNRGGLSLLAAREAMCTGGALVIIDRRRQFYPPAVAAWGIDLRRVVFVHPRNAPEESWALIQALRCEGVAAVLGQVGNTDHQSLRRFQLAAEHGGSLGLFWRPAKVRGLPTWADVQLSVRGIGHLFQPRVTAGSGLGVERKRLVTSSRLFQVEVLRCRGGSGGQRIDLEMDEVSGEIRQAETIRVRTDHETAPVHLATQLAHPAPLRRSS